MKSHKLLAGTITAAVVATSANAATPTFVHADSVQFKDVSEDAYYYDDVHWLIQEGIINGYSDGTFQPNKALTREEAAAMFVRALKLKTPANYSSILTDYNDINLEKWSAKDLATFIDAEISNENSAYFYPSAPLTREVMASWLVGAFNFEKIDNKGIPFKDISQISSEHLDNVKILYQNEIVQGNTDGTYAPKTAVTRAQFAIFMKRALTSANIEPPEEKVTTKPLEFEDAESTNLKQVKITTNHTGYNAQDITNKEYYHIEDSNGNSVKVVHVEVNHKEILLTLEKAFKQSEKATLFINSSITGEEEDFRLTFRDNDEPEIVDILPTSKNSYVIHFSEPLDFGVENGQRLTDKDLFDSLEIDGDKYSIDKITVEQYGQALHVELDSKLREGKHELELTDIDWFIDYDGNKLETESFDFTMKYETTAPELVKIKNVQPNQITVVFDKHIKLRYRGYIYHTSSSHYPDRAEVQNGNELVLTFDSKDFITKSTNLVLEKGAVEDLWGYQNKKLTKSFDISEDKIPPVITNVELIDGTVANNKNIKMKVTFSEAVKKNDVEDVDNYQLTDEKGKTIKIKEISFETNSTNQNIATFTIDKYYGEVPKQEFTLEAEKLEDLVGNESEDIDYSFTVSSEKAPGDFSAKLVLNDEEDEVRIIIDFGKKMTLSGNDSINQLDLYELTVNDKTILLEDLKAVSGFNVSFTPFQKGEKAEILIEKRGNLADAWDDFFDDLVDAVEDEDLDEIGLVIGRVADENGNRTQSIVNNVKLSVQGEFDVDQVKAKATDVDTIELEFEDELTNFDKNDFVAFWDRDQDGKFDSREELDATISIDTEDGQSIVLFKLDDELDSDGEYNNRYVYVATDGSVQTKTRYGQTIKIKKIRVEDGIAPKIDTRRGDELVYVQPISNDSARAIVTLEFTDDIDEDTVTRLAFEIGDGKEYEVESVFVENSDKIGLVVNLDGNPVSNLVGEYVKQKAAITDENNNIINGINVRIHEEKSKRSRP